MDFKIISTLAVLSEGNKGWTKQLNFMTWGDRPAQYDIRSWNEDHTKMGKGITLSKDELKNLRDVLETVEFGELNPADFEGVLDL